MGAAERDGKDAVQWFWLVKTESVTSIASLGALLKPMRRQRDKQQTHVQLRRRKEKIIK